MIILRGKTGESWEDGSGMLIIPDSLELPDTEDEGPDEDEWADEFVKELIEYMSKAIRNKEG